ncbi:MAG: MFS transporter [Candidatus Heimdallarchaeota archaeon]|nr:MFS transporter [Candidatus Heimdallarchaeota archaeon]
MGFANYSRLKSGEFFGLSSFHFLVFFRRLLIYTFLSIYLKENIGLSTTEITLMATLPMIISASAQSFLWGPLIDKIHKSHRFVIIGEVVAAFLHLIMVQLHIYSLDNYSLSFAGYTIIGMLVIIELPWSASNIGLMTLIAERTDDEERTRLIGQLSVGGGLGGIIGAFTGSLFYKGGIGFSEGILFYIAVILMFISAFIIYFAIKDVNNERDSVNDNAEALLVENKQSNFDMKYSFIPFIIALTFINFGKNGVGIIISLFIANDETINATDSQIALYRNLGSIFSLVTGIIVGSRLGKTNDTIILRIGTIMTIIALFWLSIAPSYNLLLFSAIIIGSANIIIQASSYSIATRIIPHKDQGRLLGYYNATFFLSWGFGATIFFAPLVDVSVYLGNSLDSSYRISFFASSIMVFAGLLLLNRFISKVKMQNDPN